MSRPTRTLVGWKHRNRGLGAVNWPIDHRNDYESDSNPGRSGIQNPVRMFGPRHDPASDEVDVVATPVNKAGKRRPVRWDYSGLELTLESPAGVDSSNQTLIVSAPIDPSHLQAASAVNPRFQKPIALEFFDNGEKVTLTTVTPGSDLTTNGAMDSAAAWTLGAGWSIANGVASKAPGTASDLEQNQAISQGTTYLVKFTVRNQTAGSVSARLAGVSGTQRTINGDFAEYIVAGAGNEPRLELVADAAFDGEIDDVAVLENWTVTVRREEHGTQASNHPEGVKLRGVLMSVPMVGTALTGTLPGAFPPVSSPIAQGIENANRVSWSWAGSAVETEALKEFRVYWDTVEQGPDRDDWPNVKTVGKFDRQWVHSPGDFQLYHYRISAVGGNTESALSDPVNATPLARPGPEPTTPVKPDPPLVTIQPDGSERTGIFGLFFILIGVTYSSNVGRGGVDKTQIQVAAAGVTHDPVNGFASTVADILIERPPGVDHVFSTGVAGSYQFSARIFNREADDGQGGTGIWSDWRTPAVGNTVEGSRATDVPGLPTSFRVFDPGEAIGSKAIVRIGPPADNGSGVYAWEVQANPVPFLTAGDDAVLQATNTRTMIVPPRAGTAQLGGSTVQADADPGWTTNEHASKVAWVFRPGSQGLPNSTYQNPISRAILSNDSDTLTLEDPDQPGTQPYIFPPGPFDAANATTAAVTFFIANNYARSGVDLAVIDPFIFRRESDDGQGRWFREYQLSQPVYVRGRWKSRHGFGPWRYHDDSSSGTDDASLALLFTPGKAQTEAIDDEAITEAKLGGDSVSTPKLQDFAVTALKMTRQAKTFTHDILVSAVDNNTVNWTAGTIKVTGEPDVNTLAGTATFGSPRVLYYDGTSSLKIAALNVTLSDTDLILYYMDDSPIGQEATFAPTVVGPIKVGESSISVQSINTNHLKAAIITAVHIISGAITSYIIQGEEIATAASGRRVRITTDDGLEFFNSSGSRLAQFRVDTDSDVGTLVFAVSSVQSARGGIEWEGVAELWGAPGQLNLIPLASNVNLLWGSAIDGFNAMSFFVDGTGLMTFQAKNSSAEVGIDLSAAGSIERIGLRGNELRPDVDDVMVAGTPTRRFKDVQSVLINGADIGLHNGFKFREFPASPEDVSRSSDWMKRQANQGIQVLDESDRLLAVIHRNGKIYARGFELLEELIGKESDDGETDD